MPTFFKENQTVYCAVNGKGFVESISDDKKNLYPVYVQFDSGRGENYTLEGRMVSNGKISLSQNPIPEIINTPLPEFTLSFAEAMEEVKNGKKVQREDWVDVYVYCKEPVLPFEKVTKLVTQTHTITAFDITSKWRIVD